MTIHQVSSTNPKVSTTGPLIPYFKMNPCKFSAEHIVLRPAVALTRKVCNSVANLASIVANVALAVINGAYYCGRGVVNGISSLFTKKVTTAPAQQKPPATLDLAATEHQTAEDHGLSVEHGPSFLRKALDSAKSAVKWVAEGDKAAYAVGTAAVLMTATYVLNKYGYLNAPKNLATGAASKVTNVFSSVASAVYARMPNNPFKKAVPAAPVKLTPPAAKWFWQSSAPAQTAAK